MKICLLTYRGNPYCGGQGVYAAELGGALARRGHEVHAVTGPPYPPPVDGIRWHRVPGLNLLDGPEPYPPPEAPLSAFEPLRLYERAAAALGVFPEMTAFSVRAFWAVRRLMRRHRFDILHDNQTLGWGLLPLKHLGAPLVATIHHPLTVDRARGFDEPSGFGARWRMTVFHPILMQGYVARRIAPIVTVSEASRARIAADFRVPPERIRLVYNGVDTGRFRPRPDVARVPGRVLYVGNLEDRNKGGRFLLEAAARFHPRARLVVATSALAPQSWVLPEIERLGIAQRIDLRLHLDAGQLAELYASAEVGVCSSLFEGFGFPAAEAMASGLPLVAAAGGALPEVVGDAGVLVPVADGAALAAAVNALLDDPPRRERLGRAARRRALERFQWDDAARRMEQVYAEALGGESRRPEPAQPERERADG
jgi:glycosyltransferase involved in cell wall biosynthesis